MKYDATILQRIKEANRLEDVLSRDYACEFQRKGTELFTLCPFHDDQHPSLRVNDAKQLWRCDPCNKGGDVFEFVMAHDNLAFPQSVHKLAERAGIALDPDAPAMARTPKVKPQEVCSYDYTDENGALLFQCVRYEPKDFKQRRPDGKGGWIYDLKGVRRVLYRLPEVGKATDVWITEGEKDCDNMVALGFAATTNPLGAGKWRDEYAEMLRGKHVIVIPDNDDKANKFAGQRHAAAVALSLHGVAATVKIVNLPSNVKDVSDFISTFKDKAEAGERLARMSDDSPPWAPNVHEAKTADTITPKRVASVVAPGQAVTFTQWRPVIESNFPSLVKPAEVCLSVVAQLLLNDVSNPFALALVDVPSSGKTITLNFISMPDLTYTTDNFTPAAFVSHASNVKREELDKVDLLPRIRYKTLIVRDLAPIFGANDDDLLKSLGILTRALDGEGLETDSGVHGKRGYKGDFLFMLLAGTTPIPPRVFKIMGNLGSRLFFLSLHPPRKRDDELMAQNRGATRKDRETTCAKATSDILRTIWAANPHGVDWNRDADPDDCLRVIVHCARLLATLRGTINVWHSEHGDGLTHNVPVIEQPDRINCLLYNLARGHALVCGRRQITAADLAPVLDVTFDSAPTIRAKLFRGLVDAGGKLTTSQVEKLLRCSKPTALKEMEALAVLDVVHKTEEMPTLGRPETEIELAEEFKWFATEGCAALRW